MGETPNLQELLRDWPDRPDSLIPVLQEIQEQFHYLPEPALRRISDRMTIHWAQVFGAAGLGGFRLLPTEGHLVTVCDCAACRLAGGDKLLAALEEELGVSAGETTQDGLARLNVPGLIRNANAQKFWVRPPSGEFTRIEELEGSILAGTVDDVVRDVRRYQEIGCDLLVFDFRMRFPDWLEQVAILAREVLPRVSEPAIPTTGRAAAS